MYNYLISLPCEYQALVAGIFTWAITALGAGIIFFFKKLNKTFLDGMLGFAAGVMIAASFFSLLSPAIEKCEELNMSPWLITTIGFLFGGLLLFIGDKIYDFYDKKHPKKKKSSKNESMKRCMMLLAAITLHNIPEGLAIGVAFGSVQYHMNTIASAIILTIGIGIQNFPEGSAVSVPLMREKFSKKKAFFLGQLSAIVEPISAFIGALLITKINNLLPFMLSFAAGAMIYVVVEELIPESQTNKRKDIMALFTLIGFSLMMILDVALG